MADSFIRSMMQRDLWIAALSGFAASVVVGIFARKLVPDHRETAAFGAFLLVMSLVGAYQKGELRKRPLLVIGAHLIALPIVLLLFDFFIRW